MRLVKKPFKILVVEDFDPCRRGLIQIIQEFNEHLDVGGAVNGKEALEVVQQRNIDLMLLDISMPVLDGYGVLDYLSSLKEPPKVIVVSNDIHYYKMHKYFSQQLISGYLTKTTPTKEIILALEKAMAGEFYFSREIINTLKEFQTEWSSYYQDAGEFCLTNSEVLVLRGICEQKTNQEISETMFLALDTIKTHRKKLKSKLNINHTGGLILFAIRSGIFVDDTSKKIM